jgi:hypothetical protein
MSFGYYNTTQFIGLIGYWQKVGLRDKNNLNCWGVGGFVEKTVENSSKMLK